VSALTPANQYSQRRSRCLRSRINHSIDGIAAAATHADDFDTRPVMGGSSSMKMLMLRPDGEVEL
jgi:hypothetical protein